jgi:predicted house-cleaning noncanonical NTP pyrophosphatase (MazG superfamily)
MLYDYVDDVRYFQKIYKQAICNCSRIYNGADCEVISVPEEKLNGNPSEVAEMIRKCKREKANRVPEDVVKSVLELFNFTEEQWRSVILIARFKHIIEKQPMFYFDCLNGVFISYSAEMRKCIKLFGKGLRDDINDLLEDFIDKTCRDVYRSTEITVEDEKKYMEELRQFIDDYNDVVSKYTDKWLLHE